MARELLTSWGEFQSGIDRLLALCSNEINIYDQDLGGLKLESGSRLDQLKHLLQLNGPDRLRAALRDATHLRQNCPRLMQLLSIYSHSMTVSQTPEQLNHLRDAMLLIDKRHGLILFDQNQPRSKLLIDEPEELLPYLRRFEDIWAEGGTPVSATTLGL